MAVSESSARRYALDPDVRLMLEVRDGSATAFEELVVRYQARLVRVLEHWVGRRELAEDLAQGGVPPRISLSSAVRAGGEIRHLAVYDCQQRGLQRAARPFAPPGSDAGRQRERPLGPRPLDRLVQATSSAMPTRQIDKAELRDVVRMAMESLGERQRLAVLLNKFEGMSYADIATAMELSPQAVKSLLSRARENLRQMLEPYFENGTLPQTNNELSDSAVTSDGLVAGDDGEE